MSEKGFSLVETLLAMFLLSLVSMTALVMLNGYFRGSAAIGAASTRLSEMMSAREQLADDLLHAVIRPSGAADMPVIFYGDMRASCFLHLTRRAVPAAIYDPRGTDIESVRYCLEDGTLTRQAYDRPDAVRDTPQRRYNLIDNIETVEIRFLVNNAWVREWRIATPSAYAQTDVSAFNPKGVSGLSADDLPSLVEVSWTVTDDGVSRDYVHYFRTGRNRGNSSGGV